MRNVKKKISQGKKWKRTIYSTQLSAPRIDLIKSGILHQRGYHYGVAQGALEWFWPFPQPPHSHELCESEQISNKNWFSGWLTSMTTSSGKYLPFEFWVGAFKESILATYFFPFPLFSFNNIPIYFLTILIFHKFKTYI